MILMQLLVWLFPLDTDSGKSAVLAASSKPYGEWVNLGTFDSTAYTDEIPPNLCAFGSLPGWRTVACDPKVIPAFSVIKIEGFTFVTFICEDTGGKIHGRKIDIWMPGKAAALEYGNKPVAVKLWRPRGGHHEPIKGEGNDR